MKFHIKMSLCMMALLSLLFGAGGSLLISESFQNSLGREKDAAFAAYRMAWGTLQIVNGLEPYLDKDAISQTMEQLYQKNNWAALRLSTKEEVLYESSVQSPYLRVTLAIEPPEPGTCWFQIMEDEDGGRSLVFTGAVETNGDILCLTATHDISALYMTRRTQQSTYLKVFIVMSLLCAALSYLISRLLTAPLEGLSNASREIASGNYTSRVRVCSQDEIGTVAEDFNTMAEQLEAYIAELRQSMERQERFVGSFAHEMKTPMTSLIGYAELLRSWKLSQKEQAEAIDYIYSEGRRLESLSRKLLDLLVLKRQDISLVNVCPADLVETLVERLRPLYASRKIELSCNCEHGNCLLESDLVWSLLLNLADNAQKAMDQGGEMQFRLEMLVDGCRIQILDSGRGIPPESLEHLTEAFYRVDKSRSRKQGGFGLGLSLCQEIVALHNGCIQFANRPEGGACVTVELKGGRL